MSVGTLRSVSLIPSWRFERRCPVLVRTRIEDDVAAPGEAGFIDEMCYRTAHAQNEARSHVLNLGVLLLGAPPFLIQAGFVAFVFSKDKRHNQE